jgi:hypothetical protein
MSQLSDMPRSEIPVDVLLKILEYVDKADLATICLLNKICCSCSQDVLYRDIYRATPRVQQTLAQSTHLARRVRSFYSCLENSDLATALRNMTSLRILKLAIGLDSDVFEGCTFKLDSFTYFYSDHKYFRKFLSTQSSLKNVVFRMEPDFRSLEAMCLPNLTGFTGPFSWLPYIIPGRPISEVTVVESILNRRSTDLSYFTLGTAPIQKLMIDYSYLHPNPGHLLASVFPSLTYLKMSTGRMLAIMKDHEVC